jgi:hypothetical protein
MCCIFGSASKHWVEGLLNLICLFDELHREKVRESFRTNGLVRAGVKGRGRRLRQICNEVVPASA